MIKKNLWILILLMLLPLMLSAVDINNPLDPLYKDLEYWQEKGFLNHLPMLRPYPAQLLIPLLERVRERGNTRDKERVEYYLREIDQKLHMDLSIHAEASMSFRKETASPLGGELETFNEEMLYGGFLVGIKGIISDELSIWGDLGGNFLMGYDNPEGIYYMNYPYLPYGERPNKDFVYDTGGFGPFKILQSLTSNMTYGHENLYFSAGLSRTSFGNFNKDGIVLSPEAPQAGRFEFTWYEESFSFSALMLQINATDGTGQNAESGKYFFLHSYNWAPLNWLELGFVESVVGTFNPSYLVPFSQLFYTQGVFGFLDSSQMGLTLRCNLPGDVEFNGIYFLDDISFNDYIKLNFDSKLKAAMQLGLTWTPGEKWLHRATVDYTYVTPYMYTHETYGGEDFDRQDGVPDDTHDDFLNMTNYTHNGKNMGVSLDPNSDRIYGEIQFRPGKYTDFYISNTWIRHGNGSVDGSVNLADPEGDNNENGNIIHDGSIFDDGVADNDGIVRGDRTFGFGNRFMDQDHIQKVYKLGLGMESELPMPFMDDQEYYRLLFQLDYIFEWVENSGRSSDYGTEPVVGADESNHYLSLGFHFLF